MITAMKKIDELIAQFDPAQQKELERIRQIIIKTVPDVEEVISYGMPGFKYKKKYLAGYCAFKGHLSFFPTSGPIEAYKDKLSEYKISKGTIQFKPDNPLPEWLIQELILNRVGDIDK